MILVLEMDDCWKLQGHSLGVCLHNLSITGIVFKFNLGVWNFPELVIGGALGVFVYGVLFNMVIRSGIFA